MDIAAAVRSERFHRMAVAVVLGFAISWAIYRLNRAFGTFLADEGYLWYGIQRVLAGEVPLRDFMAYELGRYYIGAGLMAPFHTQDLLAMRAMLGVVAGVGLSFCIWLMARHWAENRWWRLLPAALLFGMWMLPRHKVFDTVTAIVLVTAFYRLFADLRVARFFQCGLVVGFAAVIGQNHGFYGLVASGMAFVLILLTARPAFTLRNLACWASGVVIGYSPVIFALVFVDGYAKSLLDAMRYLLVEYKGTNLPLPVPWPWVAAAHGPMTSWQTVFVGYFFLALPAAALAGLAVLAVRARHGLRVEDALFTSSLLVSIPYFNVAFSRADAGHLAQAIIPFFILLLSAPWPWQGRKTFRSGATVVLIAVSLPVVIPMEPRTAAMQAGGSFQTIVVGKDLVSVDPTLATIMHFVDRERGDRPVFAAPFYPGMSAALMQRSPTWEIYPIFPRGAAFEANEIARLKAAGPGLLLISLAALDGRPELAYPVTHPLTYRYITEHYIKQDAAIPGVDMEVYRLPVAAAGSAESPGR